MGLPQWLSGKEPACQCRRLRFDPGVGKSPWRRAWQPTPGFLPGKSHRGAWRATIRAITKSWTHTHKENSAIPSTVWHKPSLAKDWLSGLQKESSYIQDCVKGLNAFSIALQLLCLLENWNKPRSCLLCWWQRETLFVHYLFISHPFQSRAFEVF